MANLTKITILSFCADDVVLPMMERMNKLLEKNGEYVRLTSHDDSEVITGQHRCVSSETLDGIIDIFNVTESTPSDDLILRIYCENNDSYCGTYFHHNGGEYYLRDNDDTINEHCDTFMPKGFKVARFEGD